MPTAAQEIQPVSLAPDSVHDYRNTFHAELCNDGFWGVTQVTFWLCRDGVTEDREECGIEYGLTEAEARLLADALNDAPVRRAA
jgi:hypothetical protein